MLTNERQLVHDLIRENTELKLRIKDLEGATGPIPMQAQKTSKPPLSTMQTQGSNEKKDSVSPLGEIHSEKHEGTRQEIKKTKRLTIVIQSTILQQRKQTIQKVTKLGEGQQMLIPVGKGCKE